MSNNYNKAKELIQHSKGNLNGGTREQAQVYATLALVDELREIRELLEHRKNAVVLDGTN